MAKHRLGQSDGRQWGGPDLITGTATKPVPADVEQTESNPERLDDD